MDPGQFLAGAAAGIGGMVSAVKLWRMLSPKHRRARREVLLNRAMNGEKQSFLRRLDLLEESRARDVAHQNRIEAALQTIRERLTALEER